MKHFFFLRFLVLTMGIGFAGALMNPAFARFVVPFSTTVCDSLLANHEPVVLLASPCAPEGLTEGPIRTGAWSEKGNQCSLTFAPQEQPPYRGFLLVVSKNESGKGTDTITNNDHVALHEVIAKTKDGKCVVEREKKTSAQTSETKKSD